jgi:hypothetical protein
MIIRNSFNYIIKILLAKEIEFEEEVKLPELSEL